MFIHTYTFRTNPRINRFEMPPNSDVLGVGYIGGSVRMWVACPWNPDKHPDRLFQTRHFEIDHNGIEVPDLPADQVRRHVGSVSSSQNSGNSVWHVFEIVPAPKQWLPGDVAMVAPLTFGPPPREHGKLEIGPGKEELAKHLTDAAGMLRTMAEETEAARQQTHMEKAISLLKKMVPEEPSTQPVPKGNLSSLLLMVIRYRESDKSNCGVLSIRKKLLGDPDDPAMKWFPDYLKFEVGQNITIRPRCGEMIQTPIISIETEIDGDKILKIIRTKNPIVHCTNATETMKRHRDYLVNMGWDCDIKKWPKNDPTAPAASSARLGPGTRNDRTLIVGAIRYRDVKGISGLLTISQEVPAIHTFQVGQKIKIRPSDGELMKTEVTSIEMDFDSKGALTVVRTKDNFVRCRNASEMVRRHRQGLAETGWQSELCDPAFKEEGEEAAAYKEGYFSRCNRCNSSTRIPCDFGAGVLWSAARLVELFDQPTHARVLLENSGVDPKLCDEADEPFIKKAFEK